MKFPNDNIRGFCKYRLFRFLFRRFKIYEQQYYGLLPIIYKDRFVPRILIFEFLGKRYCYNKYNCLNYNHHPGAKWNHRYPKSGRYSSLFYVDTLKKMWKDLMDNL